MDSTGIRHRFSKDTSNTTAVTEEITQNIQTVQKEDDFAVPSDSPVVGTIAAAFLSSKGTELLMFAKEKVEQHQINTSLIKSKDSKYNILLMTLPFARMVTTAEELGLRKRDLEGHIRTFAEKDIALFTSNPSPNNVFSQSEQILLLEYCLDQIRPDATFDDVIGNESILEWCKRQNYLDDVFPLHHRPTAEAILKELSLSSPRYDIGGISKLQDYFGDKVALYFAFLNFYTKQLTVYGFVGFLVTVASLVLPHKVPILLFLYSIFASMWGASMISLWKRKNVEIVYMWKSLIMGDSSDESLMSMTKKEDVRRRFHGIEVSHRITGEKVVVFPKRLKMIRFAVSAAVVLISLYISTKLMLLALDFEDIMNSWLENNSHKHRWSSPFIMRGLVLKNTPLAIYLGCLNVLDKAYSTIAKKLTENENHKYQSDHENSLVFKLVLFQFLNMNMAYLHVAYIRRDYLRLATSIRSVLFVELIIGNIKEVIIPIFLAKRRRKAKLAEALQKKKEENPDLDETECFVEPSDLDPISTQLEMEPYDGVFDDYFELVRQFGQISLFAAAFPLGALLATMNNFMEIYTDTYKLVHMTRRASPRRALSIGAWLKAFEFISIISILTNLSIITITAKYADAVVGKNKDKTHEYFWMIVIEHVLLVVRFAFMAVSEGIPSWIRDQRAKEKYLASKSRNSAQNSTTENTQS